MKYPWTLLRTTTSIANSTLRSTRPRVSSSSAAASASDWVLENSTKSSWNASELIRESSLRELLGCKIKSLRLSAVPTSSNGTLWTLNGGLNGATSQTSTNQNWFCNSCKEAEMITCSALIITKLSGTNRLSFTRGLDGLRMKSSWSIEMQTLGMKRSIHTIHRLDASETTSRSTMILKPYSLVFGCTCTRGTRLILRLFVTWSKTST